jgi:hypothetical protein
LPDAPESGAPDAAWKALRAVIPWQADSGPEVPAGELAYPLMVANPASPFLGGDHDPAAEVRAATKRALKKVGVRRAILRRQARSG